jgi:hypothetical protein
MRPPAALVLLAVSALAAPAAEPGPDSLPPAGADGWVRLFDGGDFSGLVIDGGAKAEGGVLVIGGAARARLSVKRDLGDNFEVRLIYRTEPPNIPLQFQARWSSLGGSSSMGTTAPQPPTVPGAAEEWHELRCVCGVEAPRRPYSIRLETWRDGKMVAGLPSTIRGGAAEDPPEVWFEVPAGTKLLLRGAAAHPDPNAGSLWRTPWAFGGVLLAVLVVIAVAVLLVVRRLNRRAATPAAPPLEEDDLPAEEGTG